MAFRLGCGAAKNVGQITPSATRFFGSVCALATHEAICL
jgi:hypothetical protein